MQKNKKKRLKNICLRFIETVESSGHNYKKDFRWGFRGFRSSVSWFQKSSWRQVSKNCQNHWRFLEEAHRFQNPFKKVFLWMFRVCILEVGIHMTKLLNNQLKTEEHLCFLDILWKLSGMLPKVLSKDVKPYCEHPRKHLCSLFFLRIHNFQRFLEVAWRMYVWLCVVNTSGTPSTFWILKPDKSSWKYRQIKSTFSSKFCRHSSEQQGPLIFCVKSCTEAQLTSPINNALRPVEDCWWFLEIVKV